MTVPTPGEMAMQFVGANFDRLYEAQSFKAGVRADRKRMLEAVPGVGPEPRMGTVGWSIWKETQRCRALWLQSLGESDGDTE